jgi:hypothetical protein
MRLASSTPTRLNAQRNGGMDPHIIKQMCEPIQPVCSAPGHLWDTTVYVAKNGLPAGVKDLAVLATLTGAVITIGVNWFKTKENKIAGKVLDHIAAQKEPTLEDLRINDGVYDLCEKWENGEMPRISQIKLASQQMKTCFRALWEGEVRKEGGTSPTDDAVNMFGLEITNLIAPARLPGKLNQQLDNDLEKNIDTPGVYRQKAEELNEESY